MPRASSSDRLFRISCIGSICGCCGTATCCTRFAHSPCWACSSRRCSAKSCCVRVNCACKFFARGTNPRYCSGTASVSPLSQSCCSGQTVQPRWLAAHWMSQYRVTSLQHRSPSLKQLRTLLTSPRCMLFPQQRPPLRA